MNTPLRTARAAEQGNTILLAAITIVGLIGIGAFAVDIGSALVTKTELQNTSDAASLSGALELGRIYSELGPGVSFKDYTLTSGDKSRIQAKIGAFSVANRAGGVAVEELSSDTVFGKYDSGAGTIVAADTGVKAVKVKARRDATANGTMSTTLGRVLGINTLSAAATSGAGLSSIGGVKSGGLGIPVGIAETWFQHHTCQVTPEIQFYPTGSSCAGWHTYTEAPASASRLGSILRGLKAGTYQSPASSVGSTYYNFTGGTLASVFDDMKALYEANKDASGVWDVLLPVYASDDCGNPSGSIQIVGYAKAAITAVTDAPAKTITGLVKCGVLTSGDGVTGGGTSDYGTLYGSPGMLQ